MGRFKAPIRRVDTAKGHHYEDATGARVPGVTTIIGDGVPKPALINWAGSATADYAVDHWDELAKLGPAARLSKLNKARYEDKDKAAKRGTEVHKAAEKLLAGQQVEVPDDIAGHVESYASFMEAFKVEPILVEFSAISYRWDYAGTADLYAWLTVPEHGRVLMLLDLKTTRSGIFGETALQLAGYRYADVWVRDGVEQPVPPVDFTGAIHIRGDGYALHPVEAGPLQHKAFLYAMRTGEFVSTSRDLVGPEITPPSRTSVYRLSRLEQH